MKIGIDAREAAGQRAGKGEVIYQIIRQLSQMKLADDFIIYSNNKVDLPVNPKIDYRVIKSTGIQYFRNLAQKARADEFDLFFSPASYIIPLLLNKPTIIIVHDLAIYQSGIKHNLKSSIIEKLTLERAANKAKKIIAVSEYTKNDLVKIKKIPANKIEVVYNGCDDAYKPIDRSQYKSFLQKAGLQKPYLLFVGTLEPRKNIKRVILAYAELPSELREKYDLVIIGKKGWYYQEIFDVVKQLKLDRYIKFLGYAPNADLPKYFAGCEVFVYPSLYEGFGIPVLQAMACQRAVITSNNSSLPEVADGGGILIDAKKTDEITNAMEKLLTDEMLQDQLAKRGYEHSKKFSWQKSTEQLLNIMGNVDVK